MLTLKSTTNKYNHIPLLATVLITLYIVAAVVKYRFFTFNHTNLSASNLVLPIAYLLSSFIAEFYGLKHALQLLWCCIVILLISAFLVNIVLPLPYPLFWTKYSTTFSVAMLHYLTVSIIFSLAILLGQTLNVFCVVKLKNKFHFVPRIIIALIIGDLITVGVLAVGYAWETFAFNTILTIFLRSISFTLSYQLILLCLGYIVIHILVTCGKLFRYIKQEIN